MEADFPAERWFWFDPPFHPNQSVLLHRQPDDVWRIDFQLGWDADPVAERQPERVMPRVQALLGKDAQVRAGMGQRLHVLPACAWRSFRDGRVLFAGDSAHGVSPFGARGANSGVQDADNLAWKLRLVLRGQGAGPAARQLCERARVRRGREHPRLDPQHRLHHAEERGEPHVPRRDAAARAGLSVRAAAGEQRPAVDAVDAVAARR